MTSETPAATTTSYDVGDADFEQRVVRRSYEVPVVVDFWAAWCAPCRQLGPMLERAVAARGGAVELARVDVDANPGLSQAFRVQGIPLVVAISGGQVVNEFAGAQPAGVIEQFLDGLAPSAADQAAAEAALLDPAEAERTWRAVLEQDDGNVAARVGLARLAVGRSDLSAARELLAPVSHTPEAAETAARLRLLEEAADPSSPFAGPAAQASGGDPQPALDQLLAAVGGGPPDERNRARDLMVDVFHLLGDDDPLTVRYRRALTAALY